MDSLDRDSLTNLFIERIYDVLWHNGIIKEDYELEEFKRILKLDVQIQLGYFEEDLIRSHSSKAGSTLSEAKSEAARLNGLKGGRPKKK